MERQSVVAHVDHIKEHVNSTDSTSLLADESLAEVEGTLFDDDTKDTQVDEKSAPAPKEIPRTQLTETRAVVEMTNTNKNIVAPGTRDAPKFLARRPEELRRFIRQMEDLWREAGISDDRIKKESIGKYADYDCEEEWAAFDTYVDPHTWEEFKEELFANYPEAAAAERGTPQRIREICDDQREIVLGDMQGLYAFRRKFMAEAKKLLTPPAVMSNRELVELFMGRLASEMAQMVFHRLSSLATSESVKTIKAEKSEEEVNVNVDKKDGEETVVSKIKVLQKRPEDRHDLACVCEAAVAVSENHQGFFRTLNKTAKRESSRGREVMTFSQPQTSETRNLAQKIEELEGTQAIEKDRLINVNKTIESKFGELHDMFKTMLSMAQKPEQTHQSNAYGGSVFERNTEGVLGKPGTMARWGRPVESEKCFYCGIPGHFVPACLELKEDIRVGKMRVNADGRVRMGDGSRMPTGPPGSSMKERIERAQNSGLKSNYLYAGCYEDEDGLYIPSLAKVSTQYAMGNESLEHRKSRLEQELNIQEREEALELRKMKLAREEKKLEQGSKTVREELLGQLTDEEVAAIKAVKSGFP